MDDLITMGTVMATDAIMSLAKDIASFIKKKAKEYGVSVVNKGRIDSGSAFVEYLAKTRKTYSKSKTILYRSEERDLEKLFEPPCLKHREVIFGGISARPSAKESLIVAKSLRNVLETSSKVLIMGIGGMGKTILMKHFCVNAIDDVLKIPVFVSLLWFNDMAISDEPLEEMIYNRLAINGFKLGYEYFKYSLEGDKYVFLLDGYDEISSEKQSIMTKKISDFTNKYSGNSFVMTSRPIDRAYCWDKYSIYELRRLTSEQSQSLIRRLDASEAIKLRFIKEMKQGLYEKYSSFVSVPLTLTILFVTYISHSTLPETLQEFYDEAFDVLLYRHDRMKEGYERILNSGLGYGDFKKVFLKFCFLTYFHDEYAFSNTTLLQRISQCADAITQKFDEHAYKSDLVDISCMLIRDGNEYVFLHRSFQEYFAAYFLSQMTERFQERFCSELIRTQSADFKSPIFFYESNSALVFMRMLYLIEPVRFEHIVLQPIRARLKNVYQQCGEDLFNTTAELYTFRFEMEEDNDSALYLWLVKQVGELPESLSRSDICILHYFHYLVFDPSDKSLDDTVSKLYSSISKEKAGILYDEDKKVREPERILGVIKAKKENYLSAICQTMMKFIGIEIKRYDNLLSQDETEGGLQDMINSILESE